AGRGRRRFPARAGGRSSDAAALTMIDNVLRNLRVLWRAESIVAEIRLHVIAARSGLRAFAGLIALFGLAMLNLAGYFALARWWEPVWAASAVAVVDFAVAGVLVLVAAQMKPGRELDLAVEVRN